MTRIRSIPGDRSIGLALIVAGILPFLASPLLVGAHESGVLPTDCLFLIATGLPCPFCGGTRAFSLASAGNPEFLSFNAVWVFVALTAVVLGLFGAAGRSWLNPARPRRSGNSPVFIVVTLIGAGWIWALANAGTIAA